MKLYNFLIAFMATVFTATAVNAQTVIPGFQDPTHGGFAHVANPMSLTIRDTVTNLGNQVNLLRTVSIRNHNNSTQPFQPMPTMSQFVGLGVDSFNIPATSIYNWWDMELHYRYTSDPDGASGPLHAGDDIPGFPQEFIVDVLPDPNLTFNFMAMVGPYLHIEVGSIPYTRSGYITHFIVDIRDPLGNSVYYDSTNVEPGWPTGYYDVFPIYAGEYCVTVRIRFTHDGPGNSSDFTGLLIDSISLCEDCPGLATMVSDNDGLAPCELSIALNPTTNQMTVGCFKANKPFEILTYNGQLVRVLPATETVDVSDLAAGFYLLRQEGARGCKFVKQ